jgi:hypothetical protein
VVIVVKKNGKGPKWLVVLGNIRLPVSHKDQFFNPFMHERGFSNKLIRPFKKQKVYGFLLIVHPPTALRGPGSPSAPEFFAPELRPFGPGQ